MNRQSEALVSSSPICYSYDSYRKIEYRKLRIANSKSNSLRAVNLNSLPLLREILRHGNVGKAAEALNISQPALSSALKQLRIQFDDELIVRSGNKMKLTPEGEQILAPLENVMVALEKLVFEKEKANAGIQPSLTIATNDHIMTTLGSNLSQIMVQENIGFIPQFVAAGANSLRDLTAGLIDFIIAPRLGLMGGAPVSANKLAQMKVELLLSEPLVGVVSSTADFAVDTIDIDTYLAIPHVGFDVGIGRDLSNEQIYLSSLGYRQTEIVRYSSYSALVETVITSRSIGLIPASLAKLYRTRADLEIFKPPIEFPPLEYNLVWLRSRDQDEYFAQMRKVLKLSLDKSNVGSVFDFS